MPIVLDQMACNTTTEREKRAHSNQLTTKNVTQYLVIGGARIIPSILCVQHSLRIKTVWHFIILYYIILSKTENKEMCHNATQSFAKRMERRNRQIDRNKSMHYTLNLYVWQKKVRNPDEERKETPSEMIYLMRQIFYTCVNSYRRTFCVSCPGSNEFAFNGSCAICNSRAIFRIWGSFSTFTHTFPCGAHAPPQK